MTSQSPTHANWLFGIELLYQKVSTQHDSTLLWVNNSKLYKVNAREGYRDAD